MAPAKKFGVKVTQYFVGFGKTVWSVKRGDTEYGVKAIPMGGFIRMVGMLPPAKRDADGRINGIPNGFFGKLIADARAVEHEQMDRRDRGPALLPQAVVEEGHRHGRRPDDERRPGRPAARRRLHRLRRQRARP